MAENKSIGKYVLQILHGYLTHLPVVVLRELRLICVAGDIAVLSRKKFCALSKVRREELKGVDVRGDLRNHIQILK